MQGKTLITPGHDLFKSHVFTWQFGEVSQCPVLPAAVFLSLPGLIVWLATFKLLQHGNLAKNSLPPSFFCNISGQSLIGSRASLGWEASWRAVVARGFRGIIIPRASNASCYPRLLIKFGRVGGWWGHDGWSPHGEECEGNLFIGFSGTCPLESQRSICSQHLKVCIRVYIN